MRYRLPFLLFPLLLLAQAAWPQAPDMTLLHRHTFTHAQMGTLFRIAIYSPDSAQARSAASAAFARVDELNQIMSDYLPESEINRLSATAGTGQALPVSPDLWHVLELSVQASRLSQGAFDVTVGPFVSLWRRSRRQLQLPSAEVLAKARQAVGFHHLRLNPKNRTVELLVPGMRLDLGAIGKGYAVDEALKVLQQQGISAALVDGGGNVVVSQPPPGRKSWQVAVGLAGQQTTETARYLSLRCAGIASSGDLYQYVELEGKRYSHIVHPQTGLGLTHQREVTILAPNGTTADWLSTALSVLESEEGWKLLRRVKRAEASISWMEDGQVKRWESKGFRKRVKKE
ncbi:FAD:protein FMN transferase [soil metagenome]